MDDRRIVNQVVVGVAVLASAAQADTAYVDDDNCPGPGDGSELNPYCSIQTAIDADWDFDEIVVAPGTYFDTINFLGRRVTLRSSDGPDLTIIDAQQMGTVVTCNSGAGPDTVLDGFTITNGSAEMAAGCTTGTATRTSSTPDSAAALLTISTRARLTGITSR